MERMECCDFWNKKTFVVVTGASRGIGKGIADHFASLVGPGSLLLLAARDEQALLTVKHDIENRFPGLLVRIHIIDLFKADSEMCSSMLVDALVSFDLTPESFEHVMCVHNAGSLGDSSLHCVDISDANECTDYFRLNLCSMMILNSQFLQLFRHLSIRKTVINITSICAFEPRKSLSYYCIGKAAREMYFKVLALEEPDVRVLNYSPGPVDTGMISEIVENSWDESVRKQTADLRSTGTILSPIQTTTRLVQLLAKDKYLSGSHVDYFDPDMD